MAFGEREVFTHLFGVVFATAVDTGVPDHCVSQKHVENVDKKQTARLMEKMSRKINTCYLLSVIQTSIAIAELAVPPLLWPLNCLKIRGHVVLLSGPSGYSLLCGCYDRVITKHEYYTNVDGRKWCYVMTVKLIYFFQTV